MGDFYGWFGQFGSNRKYSKIWQIRKYQDMLKRLKTTFTFWARQGLYIVSQYVSRFIQVWGTFYCQLYVDHVQIQTELKQVINWHTCYLSFFLHQHNLGPVENFTHKSTQICDGNTAVQNFTYISKTVPRNCILCA